MNTITAMIEQIIDILEQSEKLHQDLLPVMDREKRAVLGSDPHLLAEVAVEKEALLAQLGRLEPQRKRIIHQIAETLDISAPQLNLSALSMRAENVQKPRIEHLRDSLGKLVKTIKRANEENRALIRHCLALSQSALGFFHHWMIPASVYGSSGRINSGQGNGKLLSGTV